MADPAPPDYAAINRRFKIAAGLTMAGFAALIVVALLSGLPGPEVGILVSIVFQFGLIGWGLGFLGAYAIRMEKKTDFSIQIGTRVGSAVEHLQTEVMDKVDGWIKRAEEKIDGLADRAEKKVDEFQAEARKRGVEDVIDRL